jgi:hypothetical protein
VGIDEVPATCEAGSPVSESVPQWVRQVWGASFLVSNLPSTLARFLESLRLARPGDVETRQAEVHGRHSAARLTRPSVAPRSSHLPSEGLY